MYVATTMANSCAAANVSRTALPEIPLSPHQPGAGFKFPKRSFGKKTVVTRSFQASWLRRVKNYLRSTMTQQRLNNLLVLHVHKDITDNLKLKDIAKEFVGESEHRQNIFGKPSNF